MSAKTVTRSQRLRWLIDHPAVWEGFPEQFSTPDHKDHNRMIFEAMQRARLFSKRTLCADVNLQPLISQARFIRRMEQQQPKPENN